MLNQMNNELKIHSMKMYFYQHHRQLKFCSNVPNNRIHVFASNPQHRGQMKKITLLTLELYQEVFLLCFVGPVFYYAFGIPKVDKFMKTSQQLSKFDENQSKLDEIG